MRKVTWWVECRTCLGTGQSFEDSYERSRWARSHRRENPSHYVWEWLTVDPKR